jgi:flagellar M-ring protein FliF
VLERLRQGIQWGQERFTQFLASLSPQQRTFLFRGLPVLLVGVGVGVYLLNRAYYRPLFTNLSPQDAAAVVKELEAQKIPYQLGKEGSVIEVPEELVYRTRLDLAGKGLPQGGGIGLELFERSQFGMSEFTQRVNYARALQGELARTISALAAVQSCRVHLALPARSTLLGAEEKPSASVVVELRPGFRLTSAQVQGIINLVSTSVAGLSPDRVTVVDSAGKLLRMTEEREEKSPTELLYQLTNEKAREIEHRIESMLEPVLGAGRAVARVAVELDSRETQRTREEYDPAGVERSKQLEMEETVGPTGGVPGVQSNVVGGDGGKVQTDPPIKKSSQVYNYEIGKTTSQIVEPRGQILRLTVGVLIDGRYEGNTYIPRSAEEIEAVRTVVMMAAGFSADRGDKIEVVNIPFKVQPPEIEQLNAQLEFQRWLQSPQGMATIGGAIVTLLLLLLLLRKRQRVRIIRIEEERRAVERRGGQAGSARIGASGETVQTTAELPIGTEQGRLEGQLGAPAQFTERSMGMTVEKIKVEADPRREELTRIARDHKDLVVQVIRNWLNEERQRLRDEMGGKKEASS